MDIDSDIVIKVTLDTKEAEKQIEELRKKLEELKLLPKQVIENHYHYHYDYKYNPMQQSVPFTPWYTTINTSWENPTIKLDGSLMADTVSKYSASVCCK